MKKFLFVFVCSLFSSFMLDAQENLASGKTATQSSTGHAKGEALKAIDGNYDGNFNNSFSITHTKEEANPWWQVDLGAQYDIAKIKLHNRTDCCGGRLKNFTILVSKTPFTDNTGGTAFATNESHATNPVRSFSGDSQGRYVRVYLNETGILSLAEVEVFGTKALPNIALGKTATQSSTGHAKGQAPKAIDGNLDGNFNNSFSITHTKEEANPWWQVDLGAQYDITKIKLHNRTDCCGSRLKNFTILVSDTPFTDNSGGTAFATNEPYATNSIRSFQGNNRGRYIRVFLNGTDYLSLAEVEVFGTKALPNIAVGKTATQSSTGHAKGQALKAIDGNLDGNFNNSFSITHTKEEANPWWQVDLGIQYDITKIKLHNRTDCCGGRLKNFTILVSKTPFTDNTGGTAFATNEPHATNPVRSFSGDSQGRYVRVYLNGTGILSLAEVEVFGAISTMPELKIDEDAIYSGSMPSDDGWNQPCKGCLYIRNNTASEFYVDMTSKSSIIGRLTVSPGNIQEITARRSESSELYIHHPTIGSVTIGLDANASPSADSPSSIGNKKISYQNVDTNTKGAYITIGDDHFGERGPSTKNDPNTLTVSSYNVYLGNFNKPSKSLRAENLLDALAAMDTDVLCLQEMNYREGGYWDALEIAAFLWSGRKDTDSEDLITGSAYARGASVNPNDKESPRQGGSFPYISQFTDGLPEKPGNLSIFWPEKRAPLYTGGGVILSKYPLEMIANITFDDLDGETIAGTKYAEQKGFIVVKINKQGQDYYILNTHTQSGNGSTKKNQIQEIKTWLAETGTIPKGARVIVAGDWNTDLEEDGVIGPTLGGYENYPAAGDIYYADTRREKVTFWNRDITIGGDFSSRRQIDWVLYSDESRYTKPKNMTAHAFPVRNVNHKYVDLSDHIGVTGTFEYNSPQTPPTAQTTSINGQFLVTITTSEEDNSSTDNDVSIRMVGYQGKATPWTLCNIDGHNDFEKGEKNTYIIDANNLIIENSKPPTIEVKLGGNDGLLISKIDVVYDGESNLSYTNSSKIWLDGDDNRYKTTAVFPLTKSGNLNYVYRLSITTNVIEDSDTDDKIEAKISGPGEYTSYLECDLRRINDFERGSNSTFYLVSDKNIDRPNRVTFKLNGTDGWNFVSATLARNGKLYTTGVKNEWLDDNAIKNYILTPQ